MSTVNYRIKKEAEEAGFSAKEAFFLGSIFNEVEDRAIDNVMYRLDNQYKARNKQFNEFCKRAIYFGIWTFAAFFIGSKFF